MPRGKVNLQPISNISKRRAVFTQRKASLFKKASELSILCGIDLCAVVYDGPSDRNPAVFSSVSDVSSLLSRFSSASEKEKNKGATKRNTMLRKEIEAKRAELQKIEEQNRELMRIVELGGGNADSASVPSFGPVPVTPFGPLGEILQAENWSSAYTDEGTQLFDLEAMTDTVPVGLEGQLSEIVTSYSDLIGSSLSDLVGSAVVNSFDSGETVQESGSDVGLDGSSGSDTRSLESNPYEHMDMDELLGSIDTDSVGSFDLESIGSVVHETGVSNSVGSTEEFVELSEREMDVVLMESERCDDWREYFRFSDFELDFC